MTTGPESLRAEFWRADQNALLDRATVAAAHYLSLATMEALATKGGGPKYMRIGRRALYRKSDVVAWAEQSGRVVENTAQLAEAV